MPVIIDGTNGITQAGEFNSDSSFGFKNRIINGAMVINQRAFSGTITTDNTYTLDRFAARMSQASKYSVAQSSAAPAGFTNSLLATSLSSYALTATDFFGIQHSIEGYNTADLGWGTANGKTVTLSFWVNSRLTGTFGGQLFNDAGSVSSGYTYSYTITVANTWQQVSITVPAPPNSTTWGTTNSFGIVAWFNLGTGTTYSTAPNVWNTSFFGGPTGNTSVVGTNGATFYITGVQLEVGSTATSFDYRPYGTETSLCQRYYVKYSSSGAQNQALLIGVVGGSTSAGICSTNFGNPMRASPTASYSGSSTLRIYDGSVVPAITSIGNSSSSTTGAVDFIASGGGLTTGRAALIIPNGSPCYVDFSAEL